MKNTIKTLTLASMIAASLTSYSQNWTTNGNANSGSLKLGGTSANEPLNFITEDFTRMTLTAQGWLGVGTTNPDGWQEILYSNSTASKNNGFLVTLNSTILPVSPTYFDVMGGGMVDVNGNGEPPQTSVFVTPFNFLTGNLTSVAFPLYSADKPMLWIREKKLPLPSSSTGTDEYDTKFIVMPDGSCGINITNPRAALDVRGSQVPNRPAAIFGSRAIGTNIQGAITGLDQYYTQMVQFVPVLDANGYNQIVKLNDQGMFFSDGQGTEGSNGASAFVLAPWAASANSDIGGMRMEANGDTEFHGTLRATKMNVDAKWWADFVFDADYELKSLAEVEAYILANKHLPDVPCEEEVLANGLDLGEMQAIQQQKIEELTLYIIQQQKQMDALIETVNELKK
jgi:hypothetical protein